MEKFKKIYRIYRGITIKRKYKNLLNDMIFIGITGTDGKSTTSEILYNIISSSGESVGILSTIGAKIYSSVSGEKIYSTNTHMTTPSIETIYKYVQRMKADGVKYCIIELTSHALDQKRAFGITLDGALFTNITHEHLDYHKTLENYRKAKLGIIDLVRKKGFVISNYDDSSCMYVHEYIAKRRKDISLIDYTVGEENKDNKTMYSAFNIEKKELGYKFDVKLANLRFPLNLNLEGGIYNIQNSMAAISAAVKLKMPMKGIINGIERTIHIKGRMSVIQTLPFKVIVDFAHTPNGIEKTLEYLNSVKKGKLISVFGAAGEMDKTKRQPMGANASKYSDVIVLTSEDPRNESLDGIMSDILRGIDSRFKEGENLFIIKNREDAIKYALQSLAKPDDIVILLGKGHEKSNSILGVDYPWDEETIARKYLNN